jgi:hypothetical protein
MSCAAALKQLASCPAAEGPFNALERQNRALNEAVAAHFGKRPNLHMLISQPRPSRTDRSGNLVFEVYDIYPEDPARPGAPPTISRLNVVLKPCTFAVVRAYEPAV